jgi:hypothetical protein
VTAVWEFFMSQKRRALGTVVPEDKTSFKATVIPVPQDNTLQTTALMRFMEVLPL